MSIARDDPAVYFESQGGWPEVWGPPPSMADLERWTITVEKDWEEYGKWADSTTVGPEHEEGCGQQFEDEPPW